MPTTYAGYDVLEVQGDSAQGRGGDESERRIVLVRSSVGRAVRGYTEPAPRVSREIRWSCAGFAEVGVLRAFLDARKGRAVPFWMLSWQRDFTFDSFPAFSDQWTIRDIGYTGQMFPLGNSRRHVWMRTPTGSSYGYAKVTAAVNNGNGTETLTIDTPVLNIVNDGYTYGFLRLCRLAEDVTPITWHARGYAVAALRAAEIPNEAPA